VTEPTGRNRAAHERGQAHKRMLARRAKYGTNRHDPLY